MSGGMGFLLGLYYDVFRIRRKLVRPSTAAVFLQDCFFCVTAAVAVFFFSLAMTDGTVRWYVLLGVAVGFWAYRYTVGNLVVLLVDRLLCVIHRLGERIARVFSVPLACLRAAGHAVSESCRKNVKKCKKFLKKVLQQVRRLLYNLTV